MDENITCISNEGKSLVDYIIASTSLFDKCTYFCKVRNIFPAFHNIRVFGYYIHYNYMHLTRIQKGDRGSGPPGKSQVIWVSIGNKQLDPPGKSWTTPPPPLEP